MAAAGSNFADASGRWIAACASPEAVAADVLAMAAADVGGVHGELLTAAASGRFGACAARRARE